MSGLQQVGDDEVRCAFCGELAAGPCASCRKMVCGDCCVLTEGGVETWAICLRCDRKKGRSLSRGWTIVILWFTALLFGLAFLAIMSVLWAR